MGNLFYVYARILCQFNGPDTLDLALKYLKKFMSFKDISDEYRGFDAQFAKARKGQFKKAQAELVPISKYYELWRSYEKNV